MTTSRAITSPSTIPSGAMVSLSAAMRPFTRPETTSFYVGRETVLPRGRSRMARWRKVLFQVISRNARATPDYFAIPPGRVVELGMQIDL